MLTIYAPKLDQQRFETVVTTTEEACSCRGDAPAVARAIGCLLGNALVHATDGRFIALDLRRNESHARLSVEDRGPGIPAEHRETIFVAYRRLSETLTSGARGLGIGLTIAREIIAEHGGSLTCEPTDGGARFVIQLPLADPEMA